ISSNWNIVKNIQSDFEELNSLMSRVLRQEPAEIQPLRDVFHKIEMEISHIPHRTPEEQEEFQRIQRWVNENLFQIEKKVVPLKQEFHELHLHLQHVQQKEAFSTFGEKIEKIVGRLPQLRDEDLGVCLEAFRFALSAGFLQLPDFEVYLHVEDLAQIFAEASATQKDAEIALRTLRQEQPPQLVDQIFDEDIALVQQHRQLLTPGVIDRTVGTFRFLRSIYQQRKQIASLQSENARNAFINQTIGAGVEAGFSVGRNSAEAEKRLINQVRLLLVTFQKAKDAGLVKELVQKIGTGDPCLNGRMGRVGEFAASLAEISLKENVSAEKIAHLPVTVLSNLIAEKVDTEEELNMYKINMIDLSELVVSFQQYAKGDLAEPFINFLMERQLISEKTAIDWNLLVPQIVALPEFTGWFQDAKAVAADLI
ncbi:MAG: hypothetical protein KDK65_03020, partial [Chlamydiia bacterium]|nr:hypothetical protein [Chlamydiia bacterium]